MAIRVRLIPGPCSSSSRTNSSLHLSSPVPQVTNSHPWRTSVTWTPCSRHLPSPAPAPWLRSGKDPHVCRMTTQHHTCPQGPSQSGLDYLSSLIIPFFFLTGTFQSWRVDLLLPGCWKETFTSPHLEPLEASPHSAALPSAVQTGLFLSQPRPATVQGALCSSMPTTGPLAALLCIA